MNYTITFTYGRPPIALSASVIADSLSNAIESARKLTDRDARAIGERAVGELEWVRIDGELYTAKEAWRLEQARAALAKAGVP